MDIAEILNTYRIRDNIIITPGKFEGQPIWAPYFFEFMSDGMESKDGTSTLVEILPEDIKLFPELNEWRFVEIRDDDYGNIWTELIR